MIQLCPPTVLGGECFADFQSFLGLYGLLGMNNNVAVGVSLPHVKRNDVVSLEEHFLARDLVSLLHVNPTLAGQLLSECEMKPKAEIYPRAKYSTKTRLIFAPNTFSQIPLMLALTPGKPLYSDRPVVLGEVNLLLGKDPRAAVREIWEATLDPRARLDTYFVYSDNIYAYEAANDTLHSLDGTKMEAQVTREDLQALLSSTFVPDVELPADLTASLRVTPSCMHAFTGYPHADLVSSMASQLGSAPFLDPRPFEALLFTEDHAKLLRMLVDQPCATHIVSDESDEGYYEVTVTVGNPAVSGWTLDYSKALLLAHGTYTGILGDAAFRVPFLPSGVQYTALANTLLSKAVVAHWISLGLGVGATVE